MHAGAAMQGVSAAQADTDQRFAEVTKTAFPAAEGGSSASMGAAMSGTVIVAQLFGHDRAQAGDIVVRSRSPVFALCRALLADLETIAEAARKLFPVVDPPEDLWAHIESAIRNEDGDPDSSLRPATPHSH